MGSFAGFLPLVSLKAGANQSGAASQRLYKRQTRLAHRLEYQRVVV